MMVRDGRPSAMAASTNSRCRSDSAWPRTMRAIVSQPTAPIARKISTRLRPNTTVRMITKNMYGSA